MPRASFEMTNISLVILIATSFSGVVGLCLAGLDNSNGPSQSQTMSSNSATQNSQTFDQTAVEKCRDIVENFWKGLLQKGDALLEIQTVLHAAIAESQVLTQLDFRPGFNHYLELLDSVHEAEEPPSSQRDRTLGESGHKEGSGQPEPLESVEKEKELHSRLRRRVCSEEEESGASEDDTEYVL
ncbi:uncharacterized protein F5891DRAFT_986355 [Suillus fuscotomentosus]|uniref:Uncharacterized protein n=1 Tax=Suillus fuscotomentosus TaxID=1912939 RepID=A0AAD4DS30_9AGAM|nr:uncharacterized protein F5891DRAFT_986355 [Suillus fuscotomentosus]KAG1892910.1 hypothetical protein F5891DRAFT_986355 [Suillus fuscotomentosus]